MSNAAAPGARSGVRIVRGSPTDEELAALVVAVTAAVSVAAARAEARQRPDARRWHPRAHHMTPTTEPGPAAWVMSALQ
ncbi:acyl-CoA carboxylase epsilon subunit [Streptomyces sp. NPDC051776]|uniref:acyl-CoA carboxylase epsilon subunit n=1 Tax=Streptomyces sp. NPDC051776 TaxID=3155414 RepID=UPI003442780B